MGKGIHEYTKITDLKDMIGKSAKNMETKLHLNLKQRHQENLERKATKNLLMK